MEVGQAVLLGLKLVGGLAILNIIILAAFGLGSAIVLNFWNVEDELVAPQEELDAVRRQALWNERAILKEATFAYRCSLTRNPTEAEREALDRIDQIDRELRRGL